MAYHRISDSYLYVSDASYSWRKIGNIETNDVDNTDDLTNNINTLKVESQIIYAEEIEQSITLQGQTIHNRTIDIKSETTGNIKNRENS